MELTYSSVVKKQRIKWVNIKRPEANHTLDVTSLYLLVCSIILLVVLVFHDFFFNFVTFFLAFSLIVPFVSVLKQDEGNYTEVSEH